MKNYLSFGNIFITIGIIIQLVVGYVTHMNIISITSGIAGVIAVVLCSQRKYIQYVFSFIQMFTYCYLAYLQHLYGELIENAFYFVTMIIGLFIWKQNSTKGIVHSKQMTVVQNILLMIITAISIFVATMYLRKTNDNFPVLDAISTMPAFVAQILLVFRYREQWIYWLIIDITSIIMWWMANDWCMVVQYVFWTINCIYGYTMWSIKNNQT